MSQDSAVHYTTLLCCTLTTLAVLVGKVTPPTEQYSTQVTVNTQHRPALRFTVNSVINGIPFMYLKIPHTEYNLDECG